MAGGQRLADEVPGGELVVIPGTGHFVFEDAPEEAADALAVLPREGGAAVMHVRDLGDGPPVVLLHAGPGLDGSIFLPGAERLARSHRLLIADLPGNGASEDGDRAEWSLAGFARAVEQLVSELGLRDWTLLGHSFGGYVAMQHLVDFPGSASRVVASCTDASEDPAAEEDWYAGLTPEVAEAVKAAEALEAAATTAGGDARGLDRVCCRSSRAIPRCSSRCWRTWSSARRS